MPATDLNERAKLEAEYGPAGVETLADELAQPAPETEALVMSTVIANSLVTRAPLSRAQIECALTHYELLESLLRISGPRFANHRRDSAEFYNLALGRLRELEEAEARREAGLPPRPDRMPLEA